MTECLYCRCTDERACIHPGTNQPCGWSVIFPRALLPICTVCEPMVLQLIQRYSGHRHCEAARPATIDQARATIESPAVGDVIRERISQLEHHGHDADADASLPIFELPEKARDHLQIALDLTRGTLCERDLPRARRKLATTAALCIAAMDRLALVTPAPGERLL